MNALAGLANPMAVGQTVQQGFHQGRQMRVDMETRNALSALAANPMDEGAMGNLARFNPQAAMQMRARNQQAQEQQLRLEQEQFKAHQQQMGTMRQLLEAAGQDPMQAMQAAQSMGIDTTKFPQPGTPEFEPWRQQQLFIVSAMEKEGESLPGLAREVMLGLPEADRDPNGPAFQTAYRAALENKYANEYQDRTGATRRSPIYADPSRAEIKPRDQRPNMTNEELLQWGEKAVADGTDRILVFRQLEEWGVVPK